MVLLSDVAVPEWQQVLCPLLSYKDGTLPVVIYAVLDRTAVYEVIGIKTGERHLARKECFAVDPLKIRFEDCPDNLSFHGTRAGKRGRALARKHRMEKRSSPDQTGTVRGRGGSDPGGPDNGEAVI